MLDLKKLFLMGVVLSLGAFGCDVDEDEGDGGVVGGEGGEGGGGGVAEDTFNYVIIVDTSADENDNGTPGVDICGIAADCDGTVATGVNANLTAGVGDVCSAIGEGCSAIRNDPNAALDDGTACAPASAPESDYVSIGVNGSLSVEFDNDLRGCSLNVVEHEGSDDESFAISVCSNAAGSDCLDTDPIQDGLKGDVSVDVPAN